MAQTIFQERNRFIPLGKDRLLNVEQVRARLGVARSTVYKLIDEGKLKGFKICGARGVRVRESVVNDYIRQKEAAYGL